MKILAMETELPGVQETSFQALAREEAAKAWELYQAGTIRELYFREDQSQAVLVLECDTIEEAAKILATLPYVRAGLIEFELIPLLPYPGFGRLFDAPG